MVRVVDNRQIALNLAKLAKVTAVMGVVLAEEAGIENITFLSDSADGAKITAPGIGLSIFARRDNGSVTLSSSPDGKSISFILGGNIEMSGAFISSWTDEAFLVVLAKTIQALA